ncbi:MAG TPA: zinc ribbon domain-containing protein [Ktedonobacteraceae bacterium]|jgi:putative FmdB family regulatory protein|nr:zinc ribbon domain-containing protein [Ktedonobacteraceae bacterium]
MPMYEYRCLRCEERFEQLVPLRAEHPPVTCPHCGTQEVRKLLSTFASIGSDRSSNQSNCAPTGG